jgi:hypothetical protein
VSTFWTVYPANDRCIPIRAQNSITFTLNAMNACADWILGTIPFFMVKHLHLSFMTKMLVASILAFAAVYVLQLSSSTTRRLILFSGSTATIVRMKYVEDLTNGPDFLCKSSPWTPQFRHSLLLRCDHRGVYMVNGRAWDRDNSWMYRDFTTFASKPHVAIWLRVHSIICRNKTQSFRPRKTKRAP